MSIEKRAFAIAAVLYGLAVHMRLFPIFFVFSLMLHLGWRTVPFGIISGATFMILNLLFFAIYGEDFLNETFLYHLVRADYRHNFSSPWLSVYLGKNPIQWWTVSRILMTLFLSFRFRKNLRFCWATIVMCFITFNPVCTVQYYDWVICLLALNSEFVLRRKFVFCLIVWGVCHGIWLQFAYLLEFCGYSVFVFTWIASVAVFFGNNVLLWGLISETDVSDESHPSILC
jgi:phosphatidylinositol glycan class M